MQHSPHITKTQHISTAELHNTPQHHTTTYQHNTVPYNYIAAPEHSTTKHQHTTAQQHSTKKHRYNSTTQDIITIQHTKTPQHNMPTQLAHNIQVAHNNTQQQQILQCLMLTHKRIILNDIIWSTRTKETYTNTIGAKTNKQNKQSDLGYKHNHNSALK